MSQCAACSNKLGVVKIKVRIGEIICGECYWKVMKKKWFLVHLSFLSLDDVKKAIGDKIGFVEEPLTAVAAHSESLAETGDTTHINNLLSNSTYEKLEGNVELIHYTPTTIGRIWSIFGIIVGLLLCFTVIGAILGVPMIIINIAGLKTGVVMKGSCPWCTNEIISLPDAKGVTCKACKKRLVIRNESFIKVE